MHILSKVKSSSLFSSVYIGSSPAEVVAGLISIHLYKTALKVAHLCKLNLEPIFEALVTSYANIPNENDRSAVKSKLLMVSIKCQ